MRVSYDYRRLSNRLQLSKRQQSLAKAAGEGLEVHNKIVDAFVLFIREDAVGGFYKLMTFEDRMAILNANGVHVVATHSLLCLLSLLGSTLVVALCVSDNKIQGMLSVFKWASIASWALDLGVGNSLLADVKGFFAQFPRF